MDLSRVYPPSFPVTASLQPPITLNMMQLIEIIKHTIFSPVDVVTTAKHLSIVFAYCDNELSQLHTARQC